MHIKTGFKFISDNRVIDPGAYEVKITVPKVFFSKEKKRVVWVGETKVYKKGSSDPLFIIEDLVLSRKIKKQCMLKLEEQVGKPGHTQVLEWDPVSGMDLFKKTEGFQDQHMLVGEFKIEPTLGYTYAGLSGDYNILHINNSVAKMVGHKSAFLQGMATANILINTIFKKFDIENIDIAFVKPVYFNQTVRIYKKDGLVFVYDSDKNLVARALTS